MREGDNLISSFEGRIDQTILACSGDPISFLKRTAGSAKLTLPERTIPGSVPSVVPGATISGKTRATTCRDC